MYRDEYPSLLLAIDLETEMGEQPDVYTPTKRARQQQSIQRGLNL
jgi:hypothetical protein